MEQNFVLGCDTSHWSGNIDFAKMHAAGAVFWFTKAVDSARGSGQLFEDVKLDAYCNQVFALNRLLAWRLPLAELKYVLGPQPATGRLLGLGAIQNSRRLKL